MLTFNNMVKEMSLNLEIMKSFLDIEIFLKTIDQLFAEIFQRFFLCLLPEDDQTSSSPIFCVDLSCFQMRNRLHLHLLSVIKNNDIIVHCIMTQVSNLEGRMTQVTRNLRYLPSLPSISNHIRISHSNYRGMHLLLQHSSFKRVNDTHKLPSADS